MSTAMKFMKYPLVGALVLGLSGCGYLFGDKGVFRDTSEDYKKAPEVPPIHVPEGKDRGVKAINELETWARGESMATAKHFAASGVNTESKGREYPGVLLVAREENWREA